MSENVDFKFINELEGFRLQGYVPDLDGSKSGVTIASGFDIGQYSANDIIKLFSSNLADKLVPYAGLVAKKANEVLEKMPLTIDINEAVEINRKVNSKLIDTLCTTWNESVSKIKFEELPIPCATVVASVSFQYGNLSKRTPHFWQQVTSGQWAAALENLRNFGDRYQSRRKKEADLLAIWLNNETVL